MVRYGDQLKLNNRGYLSYSVLKSILVIMLVVGQPVAAMPEEPKHWPEDQPWYIGFSERFADNQTSLFWDVTKSQIGRDDRRVTTDGWLGKGSTIQVIIHENIDDFNLVGRSEVDDADLARTYFDILTNGNYNETEEVYSSYIADDIRKITLNAELTPSTSNGLPVLLVPVREIYRGGEEVNLFVKEGVVDPRDVPTRPGWEFRGWSNSTYTKNIYCSYDYEFNEESITTTIEQCFHIGLGIMTYTYFHFEREGDVYELEIQFNGSALPYDPSLRMSYSREYYINHPITVISVAMLVVGVIFFVIYRRRNAGAKKEKSNDLYPE